MMRLLIWGFGLLAVVVSVQSAYAVHYVVYVANEGSGTVSMLDATRNAVLADIPAEAGTHDLALSPDGRTLYVANLSGFLQVIDIRTNRTLKMLRLGQRTHATTLSPDGRRAWVSVTGENTLVILDTATLEPLTRVSLRGPVHTIFARGRAYQTLGPDNVVGVLDSQTYQVLATIPVGRSPAALWASPDGREVWVANTGEDTLSIIDTASQKAVGTVQVGARPGHPMFTADGRLVYIPVASENVVAVIDAARRVMVAKISVGASPHGIALTPDDRLAYVTNDAGHSVSVIDTAGRTVTATIPVGQKPIGIVVAGF